MTILQLSLRNWLGLELSFDSTVSVALLAFRPNAIQVESRLVLINWTLNVERVYKVLSFKFRVCMLVVDSKVNIFFHFLQGHRWCSEGLFVLLIDSIICLSIDALMFNVIVETFFVGFYLKVLGDVIFVGIDFVLGKSGETCVLPWNFAFVRLHKGRVVSVFFRNNF